MKQKLTLVVVLLLVGLSPQLAACAGGGAGLTGEGIAHFCGR